MKHTCVIIGTCLPFVSLNGKVLYCELLESPWHTDPLFLIPEVSFLFKPKLSFHTLWLKKDSCWKSNSRDSEKPAKIRRPYLTETHLHMVHRYLSPHYHSFFRHRNWNLGTQKMWCIGQFIYKLKSLCFYCTELKIKKYIQLSGTVLSKKTLFTLINWRKTHLPI